MPSAENFNRRVTARIKQSQLTLTVHYPAARPAGTGTAPGAVPLSPLTGPLPTTQIIPSAVTESASPVTVPCLWTDMSAGGVGADLIRDEIRRFGPGWVEGSSAIARVCVEDAAVDPDVPFGRTIFTGCAYVDFEGKRFTVLTVKAPHPSFARPVSYYVWLTGADVQG